MNVDHLRYFVAVAELEHVTRAAEAVHVSQPALSRAIARLERELGVALLERRARVVRLTPQGRLFAVHARRALAEIDDGRRALAGAQDPDRGEVPFAFLHTLGSWLVPSLLGAYRERRPAVAFRLEQASASAMVEALLEGAVDLALTSPHPHHDDVGWHAVMTEPLLLSVPPDHRLAGRRGVRLAEVADDPWIVMRPGYGLRATTDELWRQAGIAPAVAFEGEEVVTLRGLVSAGLGVALLPVARSAGAAIAVPTPQLRVADRGCTRTIGLAWNARRRLLPVVDAFRAFVRAEGRALALAATEPPGA